MSRLDGARGIAYMGIASGAAASPVAFVSGWDVAAVAQRTDITPYGAKQHIYIAGITEFAGSFDGWYDDASSQTYVAAVDGAPRKFYLYPSVAAPDEFFYGLILPDFSVAAGVQAAAAVKCSWSAAGAFGRTPPFPPLAPMQDEAYNDILDQAYGVMS